VFFVAKTITLQHRRAGGGAVLGFLREARHDRGRAGARPSRLRRIIVPAIVGASFMV